MTAHGIARALRASVFGLSALLGSMHAASAATSVSGPIANDARWTLAQSPYVVTADVSVVANATLTIEPGVRVYFAPGRNLTVMSGALVAVGGGTSPIVFSSKNVLDGLPAARGDWGQVRFLDGTVDATTRLDQVVVEHGHGLEFVAASPRIDHVTLRQNAGAAVRIDLKSSPAGVGNLASDNDLDAIAVPAGAIAGDVTWGLHGIQYLVASGTVEVGAAPALTSVSPPSAQVGETVDVVLSGTRLTGLTGVAFDRVGVAATQASPATDTSANMQFVVAEDAAPGPLKITALTDAGEVVLADAFTVTPRQPKLVSIAPTQAFVGQGDSTLDVTGTSLQAETVVMLDATALATTVVSPEHATAVLPSPATTGTRQVSLRTPDPASPGTWFTSASLPLEVLSPTLAVTPAALNAQVGQTPTFKVVLPNAAPAGGLVVNVSSTNTAVATVAQPTVTVQPGATEADIVVTARALGTTAIRATRAGYLMGSANLGVTLPPALSMSPSIVNVAVGATLPVALNLVPAPVQDTIVNLASSNPNAFTVPAQLTVPAGSASIAVPITGVLAGQGSVNASSAGYSNSSATVLVAPNSILLPTSAFVAPNTARTLTLALNAPAPAGGLVVTLASSNTAILSVPASVTVAEGQASAVIANVQGIAQGTATLTASGAGFASATTTFNVRSVNIYLYTGTYSLPVGFSTTETVYLSEVAPAGGLSIDLTLDKPELGTLDKVRVDIPAGSNTSSFAAPLFTAVAPGQVRITASSPGLNPSNAYVTVTPPPTINLGCGCTAGITPAIGKGLINRSGLYVSVGYAPTTPLTVTIANSQPDKVSVPASVVIPAGQTYFYMPVSGLQLTSTPATISVSAPGYAAGNASMQLDVLPAQPVIYSQATMRVVGDGRSPLYVSLTSARPLGGSFEPLAPLTIGLSLESATPLGIVDGFYDVYSGGTPKSEFTFPVNTQSLTAYVGDTTTTGSYQPRAEIAGGGSVLGQVTQVVRPKLTWEYDIVRPVRGFQTTGWSSAIDREVLPNVPRNTIVIYLTSSDPRIQVPASVTMQYYRNDVAIPISVAADVPVGTTATLSASSPGFESPVDLPVEVADPEFEGYLDYGTTMFVGQQRQYFSLDAYDETGEWLRSIADPFDVGVAIVESNPEGIVGGLYENSTSTTPITGMTWNTGYSDVYAYLGTPTAQGTFKIQYSPAGYPTGTFGPITVAPGQLRFNSGQVGTPQTLGKSLKTSYCVWLYSASGNSVRTEVPVDVTFSSSDPSKVQPSPATVTIPARSDGACTSAIGMGTTSSPVTFDASAPGFDSPASKVSINVVPVEWRMYNNVSNCSRGICTYSMRSPVWAAERSPQAVSIVSFYNNVPLNQAWGLGGSTAVTLGLESETPAGALEGFFNVQSGGTPVSSVAMGSPFYIGRFASPGNYTVRATLPDGTNVLGGPITVNQDSLTLNPASADVGLGTKIWLEVRRSSPYSSVGDAVAIGCVDTAVCSTPASATMSSYAYYSYASFQITGLQEGQTILTAAMPGVLPLQVGVNVAKPTVKVEYLPATLTVGGSTTLSVHLRSTSNTELTTLASRTVTLKLDAPGIVSVPATVTIPANQSAVSFTVQGLAKGTVTLTAEEPGSTSNAGSITVN
jgi:hypothetical protein